MPVQTWTNGQAFLDAAADFLHAREDIHGLLLGLANRQAKTPPPDPTMRFLLADRGGVPVAAACHTFPAGRTALGMGPHQAIEDIAQTLHAHHPVLHNLNGPVASVTAFVQQWQQLTGMSGHVTRHMRLHRLDELSAVPMPAGMLRRATPDDASYIYEWSVAFCEETDQPFPPTTDGVRRVLSHPDPRFYVWCVNDRPVSMVAWARPTTNGISINSVYTPKHLRGRGYATAAVHRLSAKMLAERYRFCILYTDLANPTSNKIYAAIGYRPILQTQQYIFDPID